MHFVHKIFLVFFFSVTLTSCKTLNSQLRNNPGQSLGAVFGAVAGGLVGSQVGSGTGRTFAIVAGTALGGWAGSELGRFFDARDRAAVEKTSAQALSSARDGQTITWKNPENGHNAVITPRHTRIEDREIQFYRSKKIQPVDDIELIGETYTTVKSANLRAAPTTNSNIVGGLKTNEQFNAMGRIKDAPWIVVAKGNKTIGYVYESLVHKISNQPVPRLKKSIDLDGIGEIHDVSSKDLDEVDNTGSFNLDENDFVVDTVVTKTQCRSVDYALNNGDGVSENKNFTACKGSEGSWEII